jgi:hypothetical protein
MDRHYPSIHLFNDNSLRKTPGLRCVAHPCVVRFFGGIENIDHAVALVRPAHPDGMCSLLAIWFGLKTNTVTQRSRQVGHAIQNMARSATPSFLKILCGFTAWQWMCCLLVRCRRLW